MTFSKEYRGLVSALKKPGVVILGELKKEEFDLCSAALNISSCASEVACIRADKDDNPIIVDDIDASILHMGIGIKSEAGELLDAVKRCAIYRKPLDRENIIEEIGDLLFYIEGMRQDLIRVIDERGMEYATLLPRLGNLIDEINKFLAILEIPIADCMRANMAKLRVRYEKGSYSDQQATERADKKEISESLEADGTAS